LLLVLACGSMAGALVLRARHRREIPGDLAVGSAAGLILAILFFAAWVVMPRVLPLGWTWLVSAAIGLFVAIGAMVISISWVGRPLATLSFAWPGIPLPLLALTLERSLGLLWPMVVLCLLLCLCLAVLLVRAPLRPLPARINHAPPSAEDLVLLSWNIGLSPPDGGPSRRRHLPRIARVIQEAEADIVCLQEVRDVEHLDLLLALLGDGWRGHLASTARTKVNAMLTRLEGVLSSPACDLPFRGPSALSLDGVEVLSVHIPTHRARDRAAFADYLLRHARSADRPLVIAGDFNMDPDGFWDRATTLFTDDVALDRRTMQQICELGDDIGAGSAATAVPSRRLDRLVVGSPLKPVRYRVLYGSARGLMDHQPMLARIRVPVGPRPSAT
jgi:endonuclease/exonuclease/phosphatase family metal-dependent hydrolase